MTRSLALVKLSVISKASSVTKENPASLKETTDAVAVSSFLKESTMALPDVMVNQCFLDPASPSVKKPKKKQNIRIGSPDPSLSSDLIHQLYLGRSRRTIVPEPQLICLRLQDVSRLMLRPKNTENVRKDRNGGVCRVSAARRNERLEIHPSVSYTAPKTTSLPL